MTAIIAREETLRYVDRPDHQTGSLTTFRELFTPLPEPSSTGRWLGSYDVPYNLNGAWMPYEFREEDGRSGILTGVSMLSMFYTPGAVLRPSAVWP